MLWNRHCRASAKVKRKGNAKVQKQPVTKRPKVGDVQHSTLEDLPHPGSVWHPTGPRTERFPSASQVLCPRFHHESIARSKMAFLLNLTAPGNSSENASVQHAQKARAHRVDLCAHGRWYPGFRLIFIRKSFVTRCLSRPESLCECSDK